MTRRGIWFGIGAFALAMMGTVGSGPSSSGGSLALSDISLGPAPALARDRGRRGGGRRSSDRGGGFELPSVLETLEDLQELGDLGDDDEDDGPDDDDEDDGPAKKRKRR